MKHVKNCTYLILTILFLSYSLKMIHKQSTPSLKCYNDQIINCDLPESYFLDRFAKDMTSRDLYIRKDECASASRDGVIA